MRVQITAEVTTTAGNTQVQATGKRDWETKTEY